ncbi:hypothetical protein [Tenacibaculum sp. Bg11-29]|nr:hypothetical protein [Tenacibaculum sp. Bg11-29]
MNFVDEKVHMYIEKYSAINIRGGSYIIMNDELHLKKVKLSIAQSSRRL